MKDKGGRMKDRERKRHLFQSTTGIGQLTRRFAVSDRAALAAGPTGTVHGLPPSTWRSLAHMLHAPEIIGNVRVPVRQ